jgi:CheY-like chemotaxis protein
MYPPERHAGGSRLRSCRREQSASVALTRIKEQGYNVVVMDVNMPLMDGAQFIDQLARQDLNPVLAIVTACSRRM